jgi:hypothetical protein
MVSLETITAEDIFKKYQIAKATAAGRAVNVNYKNWDKIKSRKDWGEFEVLAEMFNRNPGLVDPDIWMKAQFWSVGNDTRRMRPQIVASNKAADNYKAYKKHLEQVNSFDEPAAIKRSMVFIHSYMRDNGISTFQEYLLDNHTLTPTFYLHYKSGKLDKHFIVCYDGAKEVMKQVNVGVTKEFMSDLIKNWNVYRSKALSTGCYALTQKAILAINK